MKQILILLVASTFAAGAAKDVIKPGDIRNMVENKKTWPNPRDSSATDGGRGRSHEGDDCMLDEVSYYNMTEIASASLDQFLFRAEWRKESFDLEKFFDDLDFSSKCTAMGGEVSEIDIKMSCGDEFFLEGFKLCKPPSCAEFEFLLTKTFIGALLAPYMMCDSVEVISDKIPSLECVMDVENTYYNDTGLEDFLPENFLVEGGIEYIEDETSICKEFSASKKMDMKVCNFEALTDSEDGKYFLDACDDAGGSMIPLDIIMNYEGYHRTLKRYPFCKPESCKASDIKLAYDYIKTYLTGEHYYGEGNGELEFNLALYNSCDETVNFKASMKKDKNKVLAKSCKWLKNRPEDTKAKFCAKKTGLGGYSPASEVCPSTCCTCSEDGDNVFLKKSSIKDNFLRIESRDCTWLQTVSQEARDFQCSKAAASYAGGYPPAYIACPETCGNCMSM